MNGFTGWLYQVMSSINQGMRKFMYGRYGTDRLSMVILCGGLVASILASILHVYPLNILFLLLSYGLMIWAIFRVMSRNTYKRYQENRKFLQFFERCKDRQHRYFECPKCHQTVRVPRGKGKVSITCPKCKEKFTRKT